MKAWDVSARSKLLRTKEGKIEYRTLRKGGREHYHLRIYLEAPDDVLAQIEKVDYHLHPSFRDRTRTATDRASGFAIDIWTWGMFDIELTLHLTDGSTSTMSYYLRYTLPEDTGDNYADVSSR